MRMDELNRPDLGNYKLRLPYALFLKTPHDSEEPDYMQNLVVLDHIQALSIDEPFAVVVTPTQDNGKYITNKGSVLKSISISGVTGYLPATGNLPMPQSAGKQSPALSTRDAQAIADAFSLDSNKTTDADGVTTEALPNLQASQNRETNRQNTSGFIRFVRLRNLIREYSYIKKFLDSATANATYLYFFDQGLDEWWRVEVENFKLDRSSKNPFSYPYSLVLKTISPGSDVENEVPRLPEAVEESADASKGLLSNKSASVDSLRRRLQRIRSDIAAYSGKFAGIVRDSFGQVLSTIDEVIGFVGTADSVIRTFTKIPAGLAARLANSLDGMMTQVAQFTTDFNILRACNDVYIEVRQLGEALLARADRLVTQTVADNDPQAILRKMNAAFTEQRGPTSLVAMPGLTSRTPNNAPQLVADSAARSLPVQPFITQSGMSALTPGGTDFTGHTTVRRDFVHDGENLYQLALRCTGSVHTLVEIIALNNLQYPYFVSRTDPYGPGLLRYGDAILIPQAARIDDATARNVPLRQTPVVTAQGQATALGTSTTLVNASDPSRDHQWVGFTLTITAGAGVGQSFVILDNVSGVYTIAGTWSVIPNDTSTYTVVLIQATRYLPAVAMDRVYGTDIQVVWRARGNGFQVASGQLGPTGDWSLISGEPNLVQAMHLLFFSERGRNTANPSYGIEFPIGRVNTPESALLYNFYVRSSLSADRRISAVLGAQLSSFRDIVSLQARIKPVGARKALTLSLPGE